MFRKVSRILLLCLLFLAVLSLNAQDDLADRVPITPQNAPELVPLLTVETPLPIVATAAWSPDSNTLILGGPGGYVLYDVNNPQVPVVIEQAPNVLRDSVAFSPDGSILVTINGLALTFWDMANGEILNRVALGYAGGDVQFSPDGSVLAVNPNGLIDAINTDRSQIYLFDVATGEQYGSVGYPYSWGERDGFIPFRFSPDGESLWTVYGPLVHAWDYRQPEAQRDPLLLDEATYFERIMGIETMSAGAIEYDWTAFSNGEDYGLWVVDNGGTAFFLTEAGETFAINIDFVGIPPEVNGYVQLRPRELTAALSDLANITFNLDGEPLRITGRGTATIQTQRLEINREMGTALDTFTGRFYQLVDDGIAARFEDDNGNPLPFAGTLHFAMSAVPPAQTLFSFARNAFTFSESGEIIAMLAPDENGEPGIIFEREDTTTFVSVADTSVDGIFFSPDEQIAVVDVIGGALLVDVVTGERLREFDSVGLASFSQDSTLFITHFRGELTFWGIDSGG